MSIDPMPSDPTQPPSRATPPPASLDEAPTLHVRPAPTSAPYQAAPIQPGYAPPVPASHLSPLQPQHAPPHYGLLPQHYAASPWSPPLATPNGQVPSSTPYGQLPDPTPRRRRPRFRALVVGVVLLAGLAGGAFAVYNTCCALPPAKAVVASYYDALQRQDYSTAYSYLDPAITLIVGGQSQPISATRFTQAAQAYDRQRGTIGTFDITSMSNTGSGGSGGSADITVRVTRGASAPYDVHLHLQQEGSDWKIIGFDNL